MFESRIESRIWIQVGPVIVCLNDVMLIDRLASSAFVVLRGAPEPIEVPFKGSDEAKAWCEEIWKIIGEMG